MLKSAIADVREVLGKFFSMEKSYIGSQNRRIKVNFSRQPQIKRRTESNGPH